MPNSSSLLHFFESLNISKFLVLHLIDNYRMIAIIIDPGMLQYDCKGGPLLWILLKHQFQEGPRTLMLYAVKVYRLFQHLVL
jgi:hypothetical protein